MAIVNFFQAERLVDSPDVLYSLEQYNQLITAAITTSSISMIASFLVVVAYIYLRTSSPDKADRISLRCVFMASLMTVIYTAFDLGIMLTYGDSAFCRTSGILSVLFQIMSAVFLALVGINLVLVFVLNTRYSAKQLEKFYYPSAFLFGLITISGPISQIVDDTYSDKDYRCYYFVYYYRVFGNTGLYWMWYYGCLMFSVLVATICSIVALIKLVREHHRLVNKFTTTTSTSQIMEIANNDIQERLRRQSNVFVKVVWRCITYPLVPLVSNIWGFVFQLVVIQPDQSPKFAFSIMDVIFKYLQGFFVSIIFFSDPAMSHFLTERWSFCKEKYVENFSQVRQYSGGQVEIVQAKNDKRVGSVMLVPVSSNDKTITVPLKLVEYSSRRSSAAFAEHKIYQYRNDFTSLEKATDDRINLPEYAYTRLRGNDTRKYSSSGAQSHNDTFPSTPTSTFVEHNCHPCQLIADPETNRRFLVPYKYPRIATVIHWILRKFGLEATKHENSTHPVQFSSASAQKDFQSDGSSNSVNIYPTIT